MVDDGELGARAGELADGLTDAAGEALPSWIAELGEAEITGAAVMREDIFDDASTVFLEARHPGGEVHAVGVLIDNNLGVMAKDILLADSIDRVAQAMREHPRRDGDLKLEPIVPGVAAGRIHAALELTDMTWDPPVTDDYAGLRALAVMRADEAPAYVAISGRPEIPSKKRDRLRDQFLCSPEGKGFAPDGEEAYAVSLAIDFCADYVDGRPLRWSPVVVELFMAAGFLARCSATAICSSGFRRPWTPGCGSRGESPRAPTGQLPPRGRRSLAGATRWSIAAMTRPPADRPSSS